MGAGARDSVRPLWRRGAPEPGSRADAYLSDSRYAVRSSRFWAVSGRRGMEVPAFRRCGSASHRQTFSGVLGTTPEIVGRLANPRSSGPVTPPSISPDTRWQPLHAFAVN